MGNLSTVFKLAYLNLRTQMEYRVSFFIWLGIKLLSYGSEYLIVWMILDRFKGIGTWSIPEVIVLWAILQLSYTLAGPFLFHSAGRLEQHIVKGSLDYFLIQPIHPLVNLIARNFSWTYSSQQVMSAVVLVIALNASGFDWSLARVSFLVLTILGGISFYAFTFLIGASLNFRMISGGREFGINIRWLMEMTQYPISIYPKQIQAFLTFVVPAAMLNYYPAVYLLDKSAELLHPSLPLISPLVEIALGIIGVRLFWKGLDWYQSGGG